MSLDLVICFCHRCSNLIISKLELDDFTVRVNKGANFLRLAACDFLSCFFNPGDTGMERERDTAAL